MNYYSVCLPVLSQIKSACAYLEWLEYVWSDQSMFRVMWTCLELTWACLGWHVHAWMIWECLGWCELVCGDMSMCGMTWASLGDMRMFGVMWACLGWQEHVWGDLRTCWVMWACLWWCKHVRGHMSIFRETWAYLGWHGYLGVKMSTLGVLNPSVPFEIDKLILEPGNWFYSFEKFFCDP